MDYSTTNINTVIGTNCNYLTGCPHRLPCGYCMIMKMPCISSSPSITWTNNSDAIKTQTSSLSQIPSISQTQPLSSNSAVEVKA